MSGRVQVRFVDFPAVLFDFVHVRCVSIGLFLVRNWCGKGGFKGPIALGVPGTQCYLIGCRLKFPDRGQREDNASTESAGFAPELTPYNMGTGFARPKPSNSIGRAHF
jgi:hypothetical protein